VSMPKRGGRPPKPERIRVPPDWAPLHLNISSEVDAIGLVQLWQCYSHVGRRGEAAEVLARLRGLAERPAPGKRFPVRRRR
jgi:hypothetical protein